MDVPVSYEYINTANAVQCPSTVHIHGTALARFFRRYLLQQAISVFKWRLPESWSADYFRIVLFLRGYVVVFRTDKFGVIPQQCTLAGRDVFYMPNRAIVANPLISRSVDLDIGRNCELVKLNPDFGGIGDLVDYYGDMMALCADSAGTNVLNSRLAYVFGSANKNGAETLKKMFDKLNSGDPAVFVDKQMFADNGTPAWQLFTQNVGQNFIAPQLYEQLRVLRNEFCTKIGIPNANTDKRERLIQSEVESNNVETESRTAMSLESLQDGCKRVRDMFGIDIGVEWRFPPTRGEEMTDHAYDADNSRSDSV